VSHHAYSDIIEMLRWFAEHDMQEELRWWLPETGGVQWYVLCSDVFDWATADSERVTVEDLPALSKAVRDLMTGPEDYCSDAVYATDLWVARKRGRTPQEAYLKQLPTDRLRELFQQ